MVILITKKGTQRATSAYNYPSLQTCPCNFELHMNEKNLMQNKFNNLKVRMYLGLEYLSFH